MAYIYLDIIGMKNLYKTDPTQAEENYKTFLEACRSKTLQSDHRLKYINFSDALLISLDSNLLNLGMVKEEYDWFKRELPSMDFYYDRQCRAGDQPIARY